MKKIIYLISILSVIGIIISGALLLQHFNPTINLGLMSCGNGVINPCAVVSKATFSTIFGIPLASLGIFFYLLILFTSFIEEKHFQYPILIIFPLALFGLLTDLILGIYMLTLNQICFLCLITYLITALIVVISYFIIKDIKKSSKNNLKTLFKENFNIFIPSIKRKFIFLYVFLSVILFASIISTTFIMKSNYIKSTSLTKQQMIQKAVEEIYSQEREYIDFKNDGFLIGNPDAKISIIAFTDFLCSACNHLYKMEMKIQKKFGDKINIIYFSFPLDKKCNNEISRTVYPNSCKASRSAIAAYELGIFEDYLTDHFKNYRKIAHNYKTEFSVNTIKKIMKEKNPSSKEIIKKINSSSTTNLIQQHINFANEINIRATPTIYINGLRIEGSPKFEILSKIIETELNN